MANILTPFLDGLKSGVLEPKGNLGDFAHAARLYVDDSFRLAPKSKFLFHVVFNINQNVLDRMIANSPAHPNGSRIFKTLSNFKNKHQNELNMLVKNVDLPQYSIETVVAQQCCTTCLPVLMVRHPPPDQAFILELAILHEACLA